MPDESNDESVTIQIDKRLESYQSWFDFPWGHMLFEMVDAAPKLASYCHRLHFNWLVTARTCFLPWLVIDSVRGTTAGMNRGNEFQEQMAMLTEALNIRLMQNLNQPKHIKQEISQELRVAASQMERLEIPPKAGEISPDTIWNTFLEHRGFNLGVWGSQVQGYCQVFFQYEHFLTRCAEVFVIDEKARRQLHKAPDLGKAFDLHISKGFGDLYVNEAAIEEARLVRHAVAHNGGLLTERLKKITHRFDIDPATGQILIMPLDVAELFNYLKDKVTSLCNKLVTMPEFQ